MLTVVAVVGALASAAWMATNHGADADARGTTVSRVLLDEAGNGSTVTEIFAAPRNWDLKWTYDCSTTPRGEGIFSVQQFLLGTNEGADSPNIDAPRLRVDGAHGSGVTHYDARAGTSYLWIVSECKWTVRAVSRPSS
jgi:hypothetical protein